MSADRPVTGPDLTPEQRETLAIAIHNANRCNCDSGEGDRMKADEVAPAVARMLADADRQGAARALTEAADAWQQGQWADAPRHPDRVQERVANAQYVIDWLRSRAALAQAAHTPKETTDE